MKTIGQSLLFAAFFGTAGMTYAQDNYDAQTLANSDLNGTARFVAMGGALGALGGDISVMGTNPAGTAMYRKSDVALSLSELFSDKGAMDHDGYRMSLDQGGVVIAFDMDNPSSRGLQYVNFGVNYQKNRNFLFNQRTSVQGLNGIFSQTHQIADLCNYADYYGTWGTLADLSASSQIHGGILNEAPIEGGGTEYSGIGADQAYYEKATFGSNLQADVNLSFNVGDQFFFGASMGVYSLEYTRESFYQEHGVDGNTYDFTNWYETSGDGYDVKVGFICRPVEDSPFRFGVSVHTPTWYRLTDANGASLYLNDEYVYQLSNADYEYRYRTPWTFGFSLGHTVGKCFAIGAEYEYKDLGTAKYSDIDGYDNSYFTNMNRITEKTLKAQHTFKVGAEVKPLDNLALRLGYNYVSSPFKKDAFRTVAYDGVYTETDWTNWGDINRFTVGFGYRFKGGYFDMAYQYQTQKGDFFAFDQYDETNPANCLQPTKIKANRSQLMATIGFRF